MQCSCGKWVTPAFQIHKNRIDESRDVHLLLHNQSKPSWGQVTSASGVTPCQKLIWVKAMDLWEFMAELFLSSMAFMPNEHDNFWSVHKINVHLTFWSVQYKYESEMTTKLSIEWLFHTLWSDSLQYHMLLNTVLPNWNSLWDDEVLQTPPNCRMEFKLSHLPQSIP